MTTAIATIEHAYTADELVSQVQRIQQVMSAVMKNGVHYGTIPGCGDKPALLKPGAEKLMMTFRLAVDPEVVNLSDTQTVRYRVLARITSQTTGVFLGQGVGECSSDEEKYAWRKVSCEQEWNEADPADRRQKWGGQGKYQIKQIRTNPADVANTVLKMAKKRALVDGCLTVTGASDIFSQDLDDLEEGQMDVGGKHPDPNEEKLAQAKAEKNATPSAPPQERTGKPIVAFPKHESYGAVQGKVIADCTIPELERIGVKIEAWSHAEDKKEFHGYYVRLLNLVRDTLASKEA